MSSRPSSPAFISAAIETAINQYLAMDPEGRARFAALEGQVIAVEPSGLGLRLYFLPGADGIQVLGDYEGEADTTLRGAPLALARMGLPGDSSGGLFSGDVEIIGDTDTGQRFKEIMDGVEVDWEEHLSRFTGDMVAHQLGTMLRRGSAWLKSSGDTLSRDLTEYLQEESRLLPTRIELENFFDDVDGLRSHLDRLDARLQRLQNLAGAAGGHREPA